MRPFLAPIRSLESDCPRQLKGGCHRRPGRSRISRRKDSIIIDYIERTRDAGRRGFWPIASAIAVSVAFAAPGAVAAPPSGSATGATGFAGPYYFDVGTVPWLVDTGDVNRDGRPDVVTANSVSATLAGLTVPGLAGISVLLNTTPDGAPTPTFARAESYQAGVAPTGVDVADLDGDGAPEIIAANIGDLGANGISVLRNTTPEGSPVVSFTAPVTFATGVAPTLVRAADINSDGRVDLVSGDAGVPLSLGVSVLLNTTAPGGPLTFAGPEQFLGGLVAEGLTVGDVNNDGRVDVLASHTGSSNVAVLVNTTPPGTARPTFIMSEEWVVTTTGVELGDIDSDGRLDLVAARTTGGITVRLNRTEPGATTAEFGADVGTDLIGEVTAAHATMGTVTEGVTIADFDGNGTADIAANNAFPLPGYDVAVFANHTTTGAAQPTLLGPQGYRAAQWFVGTNSIATADFNADGKPDLVTGNVPSVSVGTISLVPGGVSVLINSRP
ncbi:FG-GAP repeat domain-containing protein [Nocardia altamirensis]|uniref:FG-GAP repeat domain-containing protein n=1 Tax=Nocardia altamirensis TaxID=472158 RepID=UPI000AA18A0C|nr:VCBS repeat-containing protein [Nocardia altamirensis]